MRLVNREFNVELEKIVGKPKVGSLRAPLEIKEVHTGESISIESIANPEFIRIYLELIALKTGDIVFKNLHRVIDEELQEILTEAVDRAVGKFKNRRRKDNLEDFSYQ